MLQLVARKRQKGSFRFPAKTPHSALQPSILVQNSGRPRTPRNEVSAGCPAAVAVRPPCPPCTPAGGQQRQNAHHIGERVRVHATEAAPTPRPALVSVERRGQTSAEGRDGTGWGDWAK